MTQKRALKIKSNKTGRDLSKEYNENKRIHNTPQHQPTIISQQWTAAWCEVRAKLADAQDTDGTLWQLQANATFVAKSEKVTKIFIQKHNSRMKTKGLDIIDMEAGRSSDPAKVSRKACTFYREL